MSDMKCPFCQQELEKYYWGDLECYACPDLTCEGYYMTATKDMWQELIKLMKNKDLSDKIGKLETELDRTRKALDKAKWWLHEIVENHRYTPISTAEMALKEITALEQKDVK